MMISLSNFNQVNDGWISKCSVLIFQSCTANLYSVCEGFFDVSACCIKNKVFVAKFFKSCYGIVKLVDVFSGYSKNYSCFCCNSIHCFIVRSVCSVKNRFVIFAYFKSCFCDFWICASKDQSSSQTFCFFYKCCIFCCVCICITVYIYKLYMHSLTDTVIVYMWDCCKLSIYFCIIHACAKGYSISWFAYKCFFMSEQNSFSTECELCIACSDLACLHRRSSCLRQRSQCFVRHMWTLLNLHCALCNFHGESHTCRTSTFLTVFLWC